MIIIIAAIALVLLVLAMGALNNKSSYRSADDAPAGSVLVYHEHHGAAHTDHLNYDGTDFDEISREHFLADDGVVMIEVKDYDGNVNQITRSSWEYNNRQ